MIIETDVQYLPQLTCIEVDIDLFQLEMRQLRNILPGFAWHWETICLALLSNMVPHLLEFGFGDMPPITLNFLMSASYFQLLTELKQTKLNWDDTRRN